MVVILDRDKTKRLQNAVESLAHRSKHLGHAVHRPSLRLKRQFDERSAPQRTLQMQEPAGHGNGLEVSFCAPAVFQTNRSQATVAKLDPGGAPRRVRLGEVGHKLTALWH